MKKAILSGLVLSALLTSCGTEGTKVEANEAKTVEVTQTETTSNYATVAEGSHLVWRGAHLGGVQPRFGKVALQSAEVLVNNNTVTNASIVLNMSSISVENFTAEESEKTAKLTGHLQTADFFDVANFPTSKFELTSIETPSEADYNSKVTGNLTILDSTKSVTFLANITIADDAVTVKSEDFVVDRKEWGMSYNAEGSVGVPAQYLVSNEVGFTIDVTIKK